MDFSAFWSSIIGGFFTILGVILGVKYQIRLNEKERKASEKRDIKFKTLIELVSNKYAINDYTESSGYYLPFFSALNRIPLIFSENKNVLAKYNLFTDEYADFKRRKFLSEDGLGSFGSGLYFYDLIDSISDDLDLERISFE